MNGRQIISRKPYCQGRHWGQRDEFYKFLIIFFSLRIPLFGEGFFFPTFDLVFIYFLFFSKRQKKTFLGKKKNFLDLVHKQQPPFV